MCTTSCQFKFWEQPYFSLLLLSGFVSGSCFQDGS